LHGAETLTHGTGCAVNPSASYVTDFAGSAMCVDALTIGQYRALGITAITSLGLIVTRINVTGRATTTASARAIARASRHALA
jgi:Na+-translocating ferredoxin:NAD+ oxidoreductase RnfE subunit